MILKAGVDISSLCEELSSGLNKLDVHSQSIFNHEVRITSGHEGYDGDGVHGAGSLHYKNRAIDIGWPRPVLNAWSVGSFIIGLYKIFPDNLFDIVFEVDHIHIEHDPH